MNIEFHYYILKGLCLHAGFDTRESEIIAYSSQFVDDNNQSITLSPGLSNEYSNTITQSASPLNYNQKKFIYPLIHFIPGSPLLKTAQRIDGEMHLFNTTPGSKNAKLILNKALLSKNSYYLGIALHAYADTWTHQNFLGIKGNFNNLSFGKGVLSNLGHFSASDYPDLVSFKWKDSRLVPHNQNIDNNKRILAATKDIFKQLALSNNMPKKKISAKISYLLRGLRQCFGHDDPKQKKVRQRIKNYKDFFNYSSDYNSEKWLKNALLSKNPKLKPMRPAKNFRKSHWYQFQEQAKNYIDESYIALKPLFEQINWRPPSKEKL